MSEINAQFKRVLSYTRVTNKGKKDHYSIFSCILQPFFPCHNSIFLIAPKGLINIWNKKYIPMFPGSILLYSFDITLTINLTCTLSFGDKLFIAAYQLDLKNVLNSQNKSFQIGIMIQVWCTD